MYQCHKVNLYSITFNSKSFPMTKSFLTWTQVLKSEDCRCSIDISQRNCAFERQSLSSLMALSIIPWFQWWASIEKRLSVLLINCIFRYTRNNIDNFRNLYFPFFYTSKSFPGQKKYTTKTHISLLKVE